MGNKNRSDSQTSRAGGGLPTLSLSLWHLSATLVAVLATLAAASYWLSDPVARRLLLGQGRCDRDPRAGGSPITLWLAALVWTLAARRSWVRRVNFWLGSMALVALSLGIMAFFQPSQGALAGFTLDGEVSLGGDVGEAIIGPVTCWACFGWWELAIAGLAVTAPPLAVDLALDWAASHIRLHPPGFDGSSNRPDFPLRSEQAGSRSWDAHRGHDCRAQHAARGLIPRTPGLERYPKSSSKPGQTSPPGTLRLSARSLHLNRPLDP